MTKLIAMLTALVGLAAASPGGQTEQVKKVMADVDAFLKGDEAKALQGLETYKSQLDGFKKSLDEQAETVRRIQRMGLGASGNGTIIPVGRDARLAMLADHRGFMSDQTAERFACLFATRMNEMLPAGRQIPMSARAKEIAEAVLKDNNLPLTRADFTPGTGTGSYLWGDEFRPELVRNVEATGVLFPRCRRVPMTTGGQVKLVKQSTGMAVYWTSPATQPTHAAPVLAYATLQAEKLFGLIYLANEYFRSNLLIDAGQWVATEFAYQISAALDDALANGDASATYGGITGILQSANISAVSPAEDHDTLTEITAADFDLLQAGLTKDYAMQEAVTILSLSVLMNFRSVRDTVGGRALIERGDGLGIPPTLNGFPYIVSNKFPTAASCTTSAIYAAFGSLRHSHACGMVRDIQIDTDPSVGFLTDQTAIRVICEGDIQELDTDAIVTGKTHS